MHYGWARAISIEVSKPGGYGCADTTMLYGKTPKMREEEEKENKRCDTSVTVTNPGPVVLMQIG